MFDDKNGQAIQQTNTVEVQKTGHVDAYYFGKRGRVVSMDSIDGYVQVLFDDEQTTIGFKPEQLAVVDNE